MERLERLRLPSIHRVLQGEGGWYSLVPKESVHRCETGIFSKSVDVGDDLASHALLQGHDDGFAKLAGYRRKQSACVNAYKGRGHGRGGGEKAGRMHRCDTDEPYIE